MARQIRLAACCLAILAAGCSGMDLSKVAPAIDQANTQYIKPAIDDPNQGLQIAAEAAIRATLQRLQTQVQQLQTASAHNVQDPNSQLQRVADQLSQIAPIIGGLAQVVPMPVPVREIVMAVLGIVGAIVAAIQSWKKKQVTTALADVVRGGELVKKTSPEAAAAFKDAQNSAQTTSTVAMVTAIRRQLA